MLPKSQRLNLKYNFKWVVQGQKIESKNFKIYFRFGTNKNPLVGVAVTKKIFPKSVFRNKAKRVVYSAMGEIYPNLPNEINLVIMPKAKVLEMSQKEAKEELKSVKFNYISN